MLLPVLMCALTLRAHTGWADGDGIQSMRRGASMVGDLAATGGCLRGLLERREAQTAATLAKLCEDPSSATLLRQIEAEVNVGRMTAPVGETASNVIVAPKKTADWAPGIEDILAAGIFPLALLANLAGRLSLAAQNTCGRVARSCG